MTLTKEGKIAGTALFTIVSESLVNATDFSLTRKTPATCSVNVTVEISAKEDKVTRVECFKGAEIVTTKDTDIGVTEGMNETKTNKCCIMTVVVTEGRD